MGIEIKITGDNAVEVLDQLWQLAGRTATASPVFVTTEADVEAREAAPASEAKPETVDGGRRGAAKRAKKEPAPNISAQPENRVDPAVAEQDAADEKAEVEESKPAAPPITHDDVRQAMGVYAKTYGMDAAMEDGAQIIGVAKISALPDDQDSLRKAVDAITAAIESNPYKRERVTA